MTMIYIGNLPDDSEAASIRPLFETYGDVLSLRMIPRGSGHRYDGYILLKMRTIAARKAIAKLNGKVFEGAILCVQEATESQQEPAALGHVSPRDHWTPPRAVRQDFKTTAVEKVKQGPGGTDGDDWYRYELSNENSRITGFHRGTLAEVTRFAAESSNAINERSLSGKSVQSYRRQKKK
jgi:RNA recognition motif-containing protein